MNKLNLVEHRMIEYSKIREEQEPRIAVWRIPTTHQ